MGATAESDGGPGTVPSAERRGTRELVRQSLISGVAICEGGPGVRGLSEAELRDVGGVEAVGLVAAPATGPEAAPDERAGRPPEGDDSTTSASREEGS